MESNQHTNTPASLKNKKCTHCPSTLVSSYELNSTMNLDAMRAQQRGERRKKEGKKKREYSATATASWVWLCKATETSQAGEDDRNK